MAAEDEYVLKEPAVQAFQFQLGMEDKMPAASINTRGRPMIVTPNGDRYVFEGSDTTPADWVLIYPDGTKDVISDKLFIERYKKPTARKKRVTKKTRGSIK
tara:strand:+ start:406 stop:708 length:303 start_codon:yes stop_codon:yes gene_type:complete